MKEEKLPIGRIDYLSHRGEVAESIEYVDPQEFETDIKKEAGCGVPLSIVLYKDAAGTAIPHRFLLEYDYASTGFEIVDSPYLNITNMEQFSQAKTLIDGYCERFFQDGYGANFSNLSQIDLGRCYMKDKKHFVQNYADLGKFRIDTYYDKDLVRVKQYENLGDMVKNGLSRLDSAELTQVSKAEISRLGKEQKYEQTPEGKLPESVPETSPAWNDEEEFEM